MLKLIPSVGTLIGGAISAATAAALTTTFGKMYIEVLDTLFTKHAGEAPTQQEVLEEIRQHQGRK